MSDDLNGLILAGGESSRMGTDKSYLTFHGIPQKDYLYLLLNKFCALVYTSIGKNRESADYRNPIRDSFAFTTPLNGIMSALKHDPQKAWLCVPVDMPYVDEAALAFLIANRDKKKIVTCFYDSDGKLPEPLLSIWEPHSFNLLKQFISTGKFSPRDFLQQSDVQILSAPDKKVLLNINTKQEFEDFLKENTNFE